MSNLVAQCRGRKRLSGAMILPLNLFITGWSKSVVVSLTKRQRWKIVVTAGDSNVAMLQAYCRPEVETRRADSLSCAWSAALLCAQAWTLWTPPANLLTTQREIWILELSNYCVFEWSIEFWAELKLNKSDHHEQSLICQTLKLMKHEVVSQMSLKFKTSKLHN